jgi:hypothetical protein
MRFERLIRLVVVVTVLGVSAEARGQGYDVCATALVNILGNPHTEYNCLEGWQCVAGVFAGVPHCCTSACKVDPVCGGAHLVYDVVTNAGDTHCFHGVSADELFRRWRDQEIALGAEIFAEGATGGLFSALAEVALLSIRLLDLDGSHLPGHVQDLLRSFIPVAKARGCATYTADDVGRVKIISASRNADSRFWNWVSVGAITLGNVVVLADQDYKELMDASQGGDLYGLLMGERSPGFAGALQVMVHEMAHVHQYAVAGIPTFAVNYGLHHLPVYNSRGYGFSPEEQEAYSFEASMAEALAGNYCSQVKMQVDDRINQFLKEKRGPLVCATLADTDKDRVFDNVDNCPLVANPAQTDVDGNGKGDACDWHVWLQPVMSLLE